MLRPRALTVCVDYDDLLAVTLPRAIPYFERILVITSWDDEATASLVRSFGGNVELYQTDAFYAANAVFNKGAAVEEGFDVLGREGWVCVFDADIVMPSRLDLSHLDPSCIYAPRRRELRDPSLFNDLLDWTSLPLLRDIKTAGYFQLFHASAPVLRIRPWYGTDWIHAGGCDDDFAQKWPSHQRCVLPFEVLHLGPTFTNWLRRTTERLDGRPPPSEADERRSRLRRMFQERHVFRYSREKLVPFTGQELARLQSVGQAGNFSRLTGWAPPVYRRDLGTPGPRLFFTSATFSRHTSDEAWQLQTGLEGAGYILYGKGFPGREDRDVRDVCLRHNPLVAVIQDKREWDHPQFRMETGAELSGIDAIRDRPDLFRVTIYKDLFTGTVYQRQGHFEINPHLYIVYYDPWLIRLLCPWIRPEQILRTWHTVDSNAVPPFSEDRKGAILSGAVSGVYPLRARLRDAILAGRFEADYLPHPGYHATGSCTPGFLQTLSRYKVAICTASRYGFALRKIVEATACGARVVTDLHTGDRLPRIDGNLIRVPHTASVEEVRQVVREAIRTYDPAVQRRYAEIAKEHYDYRRMGKYVADWIERKRKNWPYQA